MLSEHPDVQQRNISQNLQLRDAGQVLHSVFVVHLVLSVHGHPEVLRVAHDDHLQRDNTRHRKHSDRHVTGADGTSKYCPALNGKRSRFFSSGPQRSDRKEFLMKTPFFRRGFR